MFANRIQAFLFDVILFHMNLELLKGAGFSVLDAGVHLYLWAGQQLSKLPRLSCQDILVLRTELIGHLIHPQATKSKQSFPRSLDFKALKWSFWTFILLSCNVVCEIINGIWQVTTSTQVGKQDFSTPFSTLRPRQQQQQLQYSVVV